MENGGTEDAPRGDGPSLKIGLKKIEKEELFAIIDTVLKKPVVYRYPV